MTSEWPFDRCIVCLQHLPLTESHVIPEAIGGRLRLPLECVACNSSLGHSIEAGLKSDPIVRVGIEAVGEQVPRLQSRMSARERFVAVNEGVRVLARRTEQRYDVLDTPQEDGSMVKEPQRARQQVETTLLRGGASPAEVARAFAMLDGAAEGQMVALGRGIAARKGVVDSFAPDFVSAKTVPDSCLLAIAYRWLALVTGVAIYDPVLNGVRSALLGTNNPEGWRVHWLAARRPFEPWHGLNVRSVRPYVVVHVRLFGQLAWDIDFSHVALEPEPTLRTYEIDLINSQGERFGPWRHTDQ